MKKRTTAKTIKVVGIDLGKTVYHFHGVDENGKTVMRQRMSWEKLIGFMANLPSCLVGMEACGSSHFTARRYGRWDIGCA